jgi:uncharacterized protein
MQRTLIILITAAFFFFCSFARAEEAPIPATPSRWVTDTVGFLSAETQQMLDKRLEQHEKKSGMKVAVWIGGTAGDATLEIWAASAIQAWKVREKGYANGVVMFILTQDRAIDVEVAPGLEKQLPDEFVAQMIFEQMAPRLQNGDPNGAVTEGMNALLTRLDMPKSQAAPSKPAAPSEPAASMPKPMDDSTEDSTDDSTNAPAKPTSATQTPGMLLLVALGALILLSIAAIVAIGWPRGAKKRS